MEDCTLAEPDLSTLCHRARRTDVSVAPHKAAA